jgi:hypothetical protein
MNFTPEIAAAFGFRNRILVEPFLFIRRRNLAGGSFGPGLINEKQGETTRSAANKVFFKADLLEFKEVPQRVAGDRNAALAQFTAWSVKSGFSSRRSQKPNRAPPPKARAACHTLAWQAR